MSAVILSLTLQGGADILTAIQKEQGAWVTPCVATGPSGHGTGAQRHGAGADDYAAKPHSQESLRRRVLRVMSFHTLQERIRSQQDEACRDSMTGLLNRQGLYTIAESLRHASFSAVYLFELDDLKKFNEKYGYVEGDHLIFHFASLLRAHTRMDDVLVRLGGDEFLVVMCHMSSMEDVNKKKRLFSGLIMRAVTRNQIWWPALPAQRSGMQRNHWMKSYAGLARSCMLQRPAVRTSALYGKGEHVMSKYTNLEVIYVSPSSKLLRGKDGSTGNRVVLKTGGQEPMTQEQTARLRREYQIMQRIDSPHVVKAFGEVTLDGRYYLVEEFCPGITLSRLLKQGALDMPDFYRIAEQLVMGLRTSTRLASSTKM